MDISVIIPCFNSENTIGRSITSLLQQTLPPNEIIVVDDGSNDHSADIAESYGRPVRVIRQENSGAAAARYAGIKNAKSEIVVFNDAGDISLPNRLFEFSKAFKTHKTIVAAYALTFIESLNRNSKDNTGRNEKIGSTHIVDDPLSVILSQSWPIAIAMNIAINRNIALISADIDPFYKAGNDYALQIRTSTFGPFLFINDVTLNYSESASGLSKIHGLDKQNAYALCAAHEIVSNPSIEGRYIDIYRTRANEECGKLLVDMYIDGNRELTRRLIEICRKYSTYKDTIKHIWWELDRKQDCGELSKKYILNEVVRITRTIMKLIT